MDDYYTFRPIRGRFLEFEVAHWKEYEREPVVVYTVNADKETCNCKRFQFVTKRVGCKHVQLVRQILEADTTYEMYRWVWSEGTTWVELTDILSVEELIECLNG